MGTSSVGTTYIVATDFNPLIQKKIAIRWLFYKGNSSVGTTYIVATDFNPLEVIL